MGNHADNSVHFGPNSPRLGRATEPKGLNLQAGSFNSEVEFQDVRVIWAARIEAGYEAVRLVQRLCNFDKPFRSLSRRHLGWYAAHNSALRQPYHRFQEVNRGVPRDLVRYGAEIV